MDSEINKVNPKQKIIDLVDEEWLKDKLSDDGNKKF